jgi:N-carbamoyl-D-amino-acid hydrolase
MIRLLEAAKGAGGQLIVFPELALTTYFPRYDIADPASLDRHFETELPGPETAPVFDAAQRLGVGFYLGYAEKTPDGRRFNSAVLVDEAGEIFGRYRKVHLPGATITDPSKAWQALEKRYFEVGDLGFPAWRRMGGVVGMCICNDRRWTETFRVLALQGAELVVMGYCTPAENPGGPDWETAALRQEQSLLTLRAGAYQNACFAVAAAKSGLEDNCRYMAGSAIVSPTGEVLAQAQSEGDELVVATIDLELSGYYKEGLFDFARHRRIEHYGMITERIGAAPPPEE